MANKVIISFQDRILAVYSGLKVACDANNWSRYTLERKKFPFIYKGLLFEKKKEYKAKDNYKIKITFEMKEAAKLEQKLKNEIKGLKKTITLLKNV